MVSLTIPVSEELKGELKHFSWVNWSDVTREEMARREELSALRRIFEEIAAKSKLTEEDAKVLAEKIDQGMFQELKKAFPGRL